MGKKELAKEGRRGRGYPAAVPWARQGAGCTTACSVVVGVIPGIVVLGGCSLRAPFFLQLFLFPLHRRPRRNGATATMNQMRSAQLRFALSRVSGLWQAA